MKVALELGNGQRLENSEAHRRKCLDYLEKTVGGNTDISDSARET